MSAMSRTPVLPARLVSVLLLPIACAVAGCSPGSTRHAGSSSGVAALETLTSKSGVKQVLVRGGTFQMGSGEGDEGPRHEVVVSDFVMDQYEVLQEELTRMQIPDASHFKDPRRPVEMVRWSEAALLCNERSEAEGLTPCYDDLTFACDFEADGYRLPTEAEWEYAARAAQADPFPPGKEEAGLMAKACYAGNSSKKTELAGAKQPNAWGLYDLQGNVAEWCQDVYAEDYYAKSPSQDPRGPAEGKKRVLRGGSWKTPAEQCRVTARWADAPGIDDACFAQDSYGFRMVRRYLPSPGSDEAPTQP